MSASPEEPPVEVEAAATAVPVLRDQRVPITCRHAEAHRRPSQHRLRPLRVSRSRNGDWSQRSANGCGQEQVRQRVARRWAEGLRTAAVAEASLRHGRRRSRRRRRRRPRDLQEDVRGLQDDETASGQRTAGPRRHRRAGRLFNLNCIPPHFKCVTGINRTTGNLNKFIPDT